MDIAQSVHSYLGVIVHFYVLEHLDLFGIYAHVLNLIGLLASSIFQALPRVYE